MEQKIVETKVCECCGRELPMEMFSKRGMGVDRCCKDCVREKRLNSIKKAKEIEGLQQELADAKNQRLSEFTPRELMTELARRGYEGKLTFTRTETIDLKNF